LQADFEKRDLVAQLLNELKRFQFCRHIQCDDDFSAAFVIPTKSRNPVSITFGWNGRDVSTTLDMTICKFSLLRRSICR
jgi:hypothetical protein